MVCECDSDHLISINIRNFWNICVTVSFWWDYRATWKSFLLFPGKENIWYERFSFSMSCCIILMFCWCLCQPLHSSDCWCGLFPSTEEILTVQGLKGSALVGEMSVLGNLWIGSVCVGLFIDRNGAVMQNYLGSPKWVKKSRSVHLCLSHLPSTVTKQFITSPPVHCLHIVYSIYFRSEVFGFVINSCVNYLHRVFQK